MNSLFVTPNEFEGSDTHRIHQAVAAAQERGLIMVIPRVNMLALPGQPRDLWIIDQAITLPSHLTVELHNCRIQLSDRCRDNFFRSANCGIDIEPIEQAQNIHIIGKGTAILQGADRPRATGDAAKTLGERTFATDTGVAGESQKGDWRNIGILMANVTHFSVQNITLVDTHCWGMSFEYCSQGILRDLHFESTGSKMVDGQKVSILNQDGVDIRQGCHDVLIENISGQSGDDLVALTAIPHTGSQAGTLGFTMVSGASDNKAGIRNVIIRNVHGHCAGGHNIIRLLNTKGMPMDNIVIDGVIDTSVPPFQSRCAVKIGDRVLRYGGINPLGTTSRIMVNNVVTRAKDAILIGGSLVDSVITNIIHYGETGEPVCYESGQENVRDILVSNIKKITKG